MPPAVREAAAAGIEASVHYPDVFCTKLVQAIAAKEGVREDCIICGSGAADLIFALCLALKPRKALLTVPAFAEYEKALRCAGCEPEYYVLKEERGFQIGEDIRRANRLMYLTSLLGMIPAAAVRLLIGCLL